MFPMMPAQGSKEERRLIKLYQSLTEADQQTLFSFAEFLQTKNNKESITTDNQESEEEQIPSEPLELPRPDEESVVKAIKRLTKNYPMVDKESILHPISGLMTSHILQGRGANEVIDDLEALFLKEYENLNNNNSSERNSSK
jgi:hypothetical protein